VSIERLRHLAVHIPDYAWKKVFGFTYIDLKRGSYSDFSEFDKEFSTKHKLLKIPPRSHYRWHTDAYRNVAINTILIGNDCQTFFTSSTDEVVKDNLVEVDYSDNRSVLLDVSKQHSVLNLGPERIVLSVGFDLPVTYNDIREYCIKRNLLE